MVVKIFSKSPPRSLCAANVDPVKPRHRPDPALSGRGHLVICEHAVEQVVGSLMAGRDEAVFDVLFGAEPVAALPPAHFIRGAWPA